MLAFRCAKTTCFFNIFNFSTFRFCQPTACHLSTLTYSFDILTPAVAHHGRSDVPGALFTSDLCGCRCLHCCRQILTFGGEKPWRSAAPHLLRSAQRRRRHRVWMDGCLMDEWLWTGGWLLVCRHQGRCLVEEGGNVTGWACVAYLLATLPTRRSLSCIPT